MQRVGRRRQDVDAAMLAERLGDADLVPRQPGIGAAAAPGQRLGARRRLAGAQQAEAIGDQIAPRGAGPIPFEHRKFGMMGGAALAVAKHMGELPDPRHARDQQLFHREFRRGVEIARACPAVARVVQLGGKGPQMRFETGADLQRRGIDLDKSLRREKTRAPQRACGRAAPAARGAGQSAPAATNCSIPLGAPSCREAAPC